jgi:pyruvate dehydrogenase E2 component (dihydrolipoamide acetyltransferase)
LSQILAQADSRAVVGDRVAWIESAEAQDAAAAESAPRAAYLRRADASPGDIMPVARMHGTAAFAPRDAERDAGRIRSTPVARKLAGEHGIDLGGIAGTGPGGRVQLDDVQRAIDASRPADIGARSLSSMPLSPMRRALARAMTLSNATIPQFTVTRSVDWTELQALRPVFAARLGAAAPKLSLNDFLLQALAQTLIEIPALNATFSGEPDSADARIVPASGAHIGLVVAVDDGLLVPVIHHVERLGLAEIARRREDCVERSLQGRVKRGELDGATFSISNLGAEGPDRFTAIINPPQSAILAVGRRRECVVAEEGVIVVRPLSELTLTVDHRVADGRLASQFLARLVAILEGRDWRLE